MLRIINQKLRTTHAEINLTTCGVGATILCQHCNFLQSAFYENIIDIRVLHRETYKRRIETIVLSNHEHIRNGTDVTMYKVAALLLVVGATALPNPEIGTNQDNVEHIESAARAMGKDCSSGIFSPTCLKIEAISMLEKLSSKEELRLLPGVSLVKESNAENGSKAEEFAAELARALPSKPDERLDKYLLYKLGNYLDTHTIKLRLLDETATEEARALVGEARGKGGLGGKKGGMGGLLALGLLFKGTSSVKKLDKI